MRNRFRNKDFSWKKQDLRESNNCLYYFNNYYRGQGSREQNLSQQWKTEDLSESEEQLFFVSCLGSALSPVKAHDMPQVSQREVSHWVGDGTWCLSRFLPGTGFCDLIISVADSTGPQGMGSQKGASVDWVNVSRGGGGRNRVNHNVIRS